MLVREIISGVFPDAVPCPNMMLGGSDAKHYSEISENILRFVPVRLTPEEKS
jgi:carboxypeptidase PM20D1